MNPSPILTIAGRCHAVTPRKVEPVAARPAERDPETGRIISEAVEAREGYDVLDVTVLTYDGGFCTVALLPVALSDLGGEVPAPGSEVEFAVRPFVKWEGRPGSKRPYIRFSVAGDVTAKRRSEGSSGRRAAAAAS